MKRLAFILFLTVTFTNAQLKEIKTPERVEIGKIAPLGQLHILCEKVGNDYVFTYRDANYMQIDDFKGFSFNGEETFDALYQKIHDGFKNVPKEPIMLELDNEYLWLDYTKVMGAVSFRFKHSVTNDGSVIGYSVWMTRKKVERLFGKR